MNTIQYISKEKKEELEKELEFLKTEKRKEIAEALQTARSFGDLSENAEYQEARSMQADVEARIKELEALLANAKVLHKPSNKNKVSLGSTVVVHKNSSKKDIEYTIVSAAEADILANKISDESPLGQALLGKSKGDTVTIENSSGSVKYKIVDIK